MFGLVKDFDLGEAFGELTSEGFSPFFKAFWCISRTSSLCCFMRLAFGSRVMVLILVLDQVLVMVLVTTLVTVLVQGTKGLRARARPLLPHLS